MSRNWIRSCSLSLSGSSSKTISGGGPTDLRIVFAIEQWHGQTPNMARFRVYNPNPDTAAKLKANEFSKVEFSGGYQDNIGLLFSGDVKQTIAGHETATDTYVDIFAADQDTSYNSARVTKTLAAGYTPMDKLQVALDAMAPFGVKLGPVNVDLSQPKFPRGIPLTGLAREIVRGVALSVGAGWSIQMGNLHIIDQRKPIPGNTVEMNGNTGMIGWPRQTQDGIIVTSLLNPALQPHVNLKINPSLIIAAERDNTPITGPGSLSNQELSNQNISAGVYNIYKIDRHGDTRGADWFDESTCIGQGGTPPSFQTKENHYYIGNS